MTYFMQSGDAFTPTAGKDSMLETLPTGNFVVAKSIMGMFFQRVDAFPAPGRLYGDLNRYAERILGTFLDRERATGALFTGEKGSGKTQLARLIAYKGYGIGIPTILVNAPFAGDEFSALLASIEQPAIVIFDEFEKVYDRNAQEQVLTLLDGTMTTKKLFLLTVNDSNAVNLHMHNRPGRLFYSLVFDGLDARFVREYCEENLKDQGHVENIVRIASVFTKFNFDILKALVEEMNRYNEDPFQALEMLNAKPVSMHSQTSYVVTVFDRDGNDVSPKEQFIYDDTPLQVRGGEMNYWFAVYDEEGKYAYDDNAIVSGRDIVSMDAERGVFEFRADDRKVVFTRKADDARGVRELLMAY